MIDSRTIYSFRLPLLLGSGLAFGSAAFVAEVDLDSDELLSDLPSDFDSEDLVSLDFASDDFDSVDFDSVDFDSADLVSDEADSDLPSDLDSDAFFESDAADFL